MQASTTGFVQAIVNGSILLATRITIWADAQPTELLAPIGGGNFIVDRNSEQRRQGALTIEFPVTAVPDYVTVNGISAPVLPLSIYSPTAPFGNEMDVDVTVMLGGQPVGSNGWVHLGHYVITETNAIDTGTDLTVQMQLYDRSYHFAKWGLLTNYNVPAAGGNLVAEIKALLSYVWNANGPGRFGTAVPYWVTNMHVVGNPNFSVPAGSYQQGQDPWQACVDMATSAGYQLFANCTTSGSDIDQHACVLELRPIPGTPAGGTLSSQPIVWEYYPGEILASGVATHGQSAIPYSTPKGVTLSMTQQSVFNDWFVSATGPNNASAGPVQAEAKDTMSQSPTFTDGQLGILPSFVFDSNITTLGQAQAEANFDLAKSVSSALTLSVVVPFQPLFDIDDCIAVTDPRLGLDHQPMIIDNIQTNLHHSTATVITGRVILPGM